MKSSIKKISIILSTIILILAYQNCGSSLESKAVLGSNLSSQSEERTNPDPDPINSGEASLTIPTAIFPKANEKILYGEDIEYLWSVSQADLRNTDVFDFYVYDGNDDKVLFRNTSIKPFVCDSAGLCKYTPTRDALLAIGNNHKWRVRAINKVSTTEFSWTKFEIAAVMPSNPEPSPSPGTQPKPDPEPNPPALPADSERLKKLISHADSMIDLYKNNPNSWISHRGIYINGVLAPNKLAPGKMTVNDGYNRMSAFQGLSNLFIATNNHSYIKFAIPLAYEYINTGKDLDGDGWMDWYSVYTSGSDSKQLNHTHYEWRAAMGVAKLLLTLLKHTKASEYTKEKADFTKFLKRDLWDKWQPGNYSTGNINTSSTYMRGRIAFSVMALHKATGEQKYLDWINTRGAELIQNGINHIDKNKNTINFTGRVNGDDVSASPTPGTVDISHFNDGWSAIIEMHFQGYNPKGLLTEQLLKTMANTVETVMFSGSKWKNNLDGSTTGGISASFNFAYAYSAKYSANLLTKHINWSFTDGLSNSSTSRESRLACWGTLARVEAGK